MNYSKKYLSLFLFLLLSASCFFKVNAKELGFMEAQTVGEKQIDETKWDTQTSEFEISPFSSLGMTASPDNGEYDIYGGNPVKITAYWIQGPVSQEEPVTITVSNGGIVLDKAFYEIEHTTNVGNSNEMTNIISTSQISNERDVMTFTTRLNTKNTLHSISFWIQAPIAMGEFTVKVTVDNGKENIDKNTVILPFNVISGLTIRVVDNNGIILDEIDDITPFFIEGMAWYQGGDVPSPSILSISIYNKETGQEVIEYLDPVTIVDRNYKYGPLIMPYSYPEGTYVVTAALVDISGQLPKFLGDVSTEVDFVKSLNGITVDVFDEGGASLKQVSNSTQFYIGGMVWYKGGDVPNTYTLSISIFNKETGEEIVEYLDTPEIIDKNYNFGPLSIPSSYASGTYVVTATLVDMSGVFPVLVSEASTEIDYIK